MRSNTASSCGLRRKFRVLRIWAPVVLVVGLLRSRVGEDFHLAAVVLDGHEENTAAYPATPPTWLATMVGRNRRPTTAAR